MYGGPDLISQARDELRRVYEALAASAQSRAEEGKEASEADALFGTGSVIIQQFNIRPYKGLRERTDMLRWGKPAKKAARPGIGMAPEIGSSQDAALGTHGSDSLWNSCVSPPHSARCLNALLQLRGLPVSLPSPSAYISVLHYCVSAPQGG